MSSYGINRRIQTLLFSMYCSHSNIDWSLDAWTPFVYIGEVVSTQTRCCGGQWQLAANEVCCPFSGPRRKNRDFDSCCENRFTDDEPNLYNSARAVGR